MNTIHIFDYGEAQIIGKDLNYKTEVSKFLKLQAVIDDIKSKKPSDVPDKEYLTISIFNKIKVQYIGKQKDGSFNIEFDNLDSKKIIALVKEFSDLEKKEPERVKPNPPPMP